MAAVARNPQGAYNDPYSRYNNTTTTTTTANPQYTGLGLQQQQQQRGSTETPPQSQQPSKKALAITSRATRGSPPPPLMGSAIVLVNDSALHCFGGRLENRELTNCHYVLDVETGYWQTILPASTIDSTMNNINADRNANDPRALFSLSLTTDPVNINSGSLSDTLSIPPQPRYFHTVNAYGTSLILFGGMGAVPINRSGEDSDNEGDNQQSQLAALADLHVYDIITQRWQHKTPTVNQHTPRARWAHLATILDHFLVVIGGTDTHKNYVEDACVLDLHTWEWVASIQNIGQCGSYRTIAATGPSLQTTADITPSTPSFPSADAFSPQISSNLSWPTTESGPIDAMATISQVLSGRISAPSSTTSSLHSSKNLDSQPINTQGSKKATERLMSGDLTPAFRAGSEMPSIYLYSNYNFQNLRRELKIITPHYTHPSASVPTFSIVEKTEAIERMGQDTPLPSGLRFPQGHVYQNQLILTGTLIVSGKAPTLAIYAFNLTTYKWERLDTDTTLDKGSWNRTLLHPATGTLLIFGHYESNANSDYSNRIQHHNHLMMVNLQAYGLYERPVPSFLPTAQDLGHDLLREPGLNDMEISSINGTLFGANSTILAARWPEFATMLLSPPYVTPLILELPVPDEVVSMFLYYLYTGALPLNSIVTPGVADYLLILARRYQLNGLHALAVDILHQTVTVNPIRIYSSALMAGELGLQARAVELAMNAPANKAATAPAPSGARNGASRLPFPPERRRAASHHSRDSVSTDGGLGGDGLMQQYNANNVPPGGRMAAPIPESGEPALYLSSPEPGVRARKMRSPPMPPNMQHTPSSHAMSYMSSSSGGSMYDSPLASPGLPRNQQQPQQQQYQQQYQQQAYPSPLSPNSQTQPSFSAFSPQGGGYASSLRGGSGSDGSHSVYGQEENDDGSSVFSGHQGQGDLRAQQAKRRLQMQMQYDMEQQQQYRMRQEYSAQHHQQQHHLVEQQQLRDAELILQQQQQQQQQQQLQLQLQQQQQQQHRYLHGAASSNSLSSKAGGGGGYAPSQKTSATESIAETVSSHKSSGSSKATSVKSSKSDQDEKKKGVLAKLKPPKPKASGAALMKSAGF
ncbi:hypothetical protein BGZ96_000342 [Linnemannia gamsii]|uniref:BTB domain-containing protein n=1 Tax=Linnemannia gamsii TaxID=64522 RepID=A0ABQ7KCM2_9FUNG|nr:hypothetical protein BGZ96_000342 [Linnemannia gamsii]